MHFNVLFWLTYKPNRFFHNEFKDCILWGCRMQTCAYQHTRQGSENFTNGAKQVPKPLKPIAGTCVRGILICCAKPTQKGEASFVPHYINNHSPHHIAPATRIAAATLVASCKLGFPTGEDPSYQSLIAKCLFPSTLPKLFPNQI